MVLVAPADRDVSILRLVDRAILEKLTDAFGESTGVPVAVLDPDGTPATRGGSVCVVCARLDGSVHHAWPIDRSSPQLEPRVTRCRCGLVGVVAPLIEPSLGVLGAVLVGPLLLPQIDLAGVRRWMVQHGLAARDVRATLAKVVRLSSVRAEDVATLFRGAVETVVQQAILANANVDLLARHSQTNRELSALCAVARAIDGADGEMAALQGLVDAVGESLGVEVVQLSLVDGDALVTTCTRGVLTAQGRATRLRIGEGFAGRVAASGEPLTCVDVQADPRLHLTAVTSREDTHAFAGVPITVDGAVVGVLCVFWRAPYVVPESEVALLGRIAQQAGAVMQRARREETLRFAAAPQARHLVEYGEARWRPLRAMEGRD
jgi:GAF domain-containing protein